MSGKNIAGFKKVCLYNPVNGDRVVFRHISTTSSDDPELIQNETGTGVISGGDVHQITISFFDNPDGMVAQMEAWENADTPLNMVILTSSGVKFWNEPEPITGFIDSLRTNTRDGVSPFSFSINHVGFDRDIYFGMNILRTAMKRNSDGVTQYNQDENYIPLRRTTSSTDRWRLNFPANGGLSQTVGGSGIIRFPFPFPGEIIYFQCNTEAGPSSSDINFNNFAETLISSETISNNGAQNTLTAPAGTFWIEWDYPNDQLSRAQISVIDIPYVNN